jgi:hemerythrin superfamily protein
MARAKQKSAASRSNGAKSRGRARSSSGSAARRSAGSSGGRRRGSSRQAGAARSDAISLLKEDHRRVEALFESFEKARTEDRKRALASEICNELRMHAKIEEEIFYPAFQEATGDDDLHHEAVIEHDGAKKLIAEIESSGPGDEYFEARVSVLSEMIRHHVREEEKRDGMFGKARSADMDLAGLGERLAERKAQLESEPGMMKAAKQIKDAGKGVVSRMLGEV